jgi:hypothetical protein
MALEPGGLALRSNQLLITPKPRSSVIRNVLF